MFIECAMSIYLLRIFDSYQMIETNMHNYVFKSDDHANVNRFPGDVTWNTGIHC